MTLKRTILKEIAVIKDDWRNLTLIAAAGALTMGLFYCTNESNLQQKVREQERLINEERFEREKIEDVKRHEKLEAQVKRQWNEYKFKQDMQELNELGAELKKLEKILYENKPLSVEDSTIIKGNFQRINQYIPLVKKSVDYYNNKFNFPEPLKLKDVCAILAKEAGKGASFYKDPMQIANQGDHALTIFQQGKENSHQINTFPEIKNIKPTKIENWKRTYDPEMNADISINIGIAFLVQKAAIRNKQGNIVGWRNWESAIERYNGGGDPQYLAKLRAIRNKLEIYQD